jgi:hypothetical protein
MDPDLEPLILCSAVPVLIPPTSASPLLRNIWRRGGFPSPSGASILKIPTAEITSIHKTEQVQSNPKTNIMSNLILKNFINNEVSLEREWIADW